MIGMIIITLIITITGIEVVTTTIITTKLDSQIKAVIITIITSTEKKDRTIIVDTDSHLKISVIMIKKIIIEIDKYQITNRKLGKATKMKKEEKQRLLISDTEKLHNKTPVKVERLLEVIVPRVTFNK